MTATMRVELVQPQLLHALRLRVLRPGQPPSSVDQMILPAGDIFTTNTSPGPCAPTAVGLPPALPPNVRL